jgi:hypothetical protein
MTRPVKRIVQVGAILAVILLLGIWLATRRMESEATRGDSAARPSGMAVSVPTIAVLDSSLRALADGERGSPRDRWDPEWLARRLGSDPKTLLAWVRIHTGWIPYHGVLRGAPGVLQDRQGNSLDRALLLASLLEHSGHSVRLAHADLGAERARKDLPGLSGGRRANPAARAQPVDESVWRPVVRQVSMQYGLDAEAVAGSLSAGVASTDGALATLDQRVETQFRRLQRHLEAGEEPRARVDSAVSALRDHWWVQRFDGDRWIDLDPLGWATDSTGLTASETVDARSLPDSMYHRVAVRLITESWARGGLRERTAFESELRPSNLMGLPISVQVWPTEWPAEILPTGGDARSAVRATALTQREWHAVLMVGAEPRAEVLLDVSGEMRHPAAGGPMGGLGRGIASALGNKSDADVFTAAWLEYETRVPGREPRRERRVLFDLPGPAARAAGLAAPPEIDDEKRVTRNLALMRQTEILPLGSVPDPAFVLHLTTQAAQRNMLLLRTRQADTSGGSGDAFTDVAEGIATPPSPLYTLAIARFAWDQRGDVFLDRPNVLSRHLWLRPVAGGAVRAEANDIVLNDVGVAVDVADGAATRLRQGIRDTNGESLFPSTARPRESVGAAFAAPGDWVVATSASDPALQRLRASADARVRMEEELNAGYVLVVRPPSDEKGADVEGWWRIDPSTGHALGVSRSGWGQTLVERAVKYATIFSAAWAFEYLICRNGLYGLPGEPGARTDGTVGFLLVKPAYAQTQFCSINALIAGILALGQEIASATWPLVLRTIAGRGYSGILSDRPWFSTGAGDPGDLPPIFGNRPGSGTPEPECRPGGGASPGQRPSGEPAPPEPGRPAEPAEAPEGTGRPPAGEERRPVPPQEEGMPYYAEDKSGMTPVPPEHVDAKIPPASAHADAMEQEFDNAVINHREALENSRQADAAFERAKVRDDQARRDYPIDSPERLQAAEEWNAASREARAKSDLIDPAARQVRRATYNAQLARYRVGYLTRLAEANRAAYLAAQARNEAATAWERTGMTDYDSPEYARFRDASERFRAAQRELADRYWGQESPARGTDNTVMPPTEVAPAPGGNAPGGNAAGGNAAGGSPAPAGCGGGPASPAAGSVVGVVGAGAGAAGGN